MTINDKNEIMLQWASKQTQPWIGKIQKKRKKDNICAMTKDMFPQILERSIHELARFKHYMSVFAICSGRWVINRLKACLWFLITRGGRIRLRCHRREESYVFYESDYVCFEGPEASQFIPCVASHNLFCYTGLDYRTGWIWRVLLQRGVQLSVERSYECD